MRKSFFIVLSLLLSFCFVLSGCNLFVDDQVKRLKQIAIEADGITITREELEKGYNSYYQTFYNNKGQNKDKAMDALIEYLVSKKLFIKEAEELIENDEIEITDIEYNYIWYSVYTALVKNIETFEEEVKKDLNIKEDKEKEEEIEKDESFIYNPYSKTAKIRYNEEIDKYEIVVIKYVLNEIIDEETGEREYDYVSEDEFEIFDIDLLDLEKIIELIDNEKLFKNKNELSAEEQVMRSISKEAMRRYVEKLKKDEKDKDFSADKEIIYLKEIERIYNIIYENILINKLYEYKVSKIKITEEDVLSRYLEKVKASYERYLLDNENFIKELTTSVVSAKSGYSSDMKCIEDVLYIPAYDSEKGENFFYVTHLLIQLSESQVEQINTLRQECEINGIDIEEEGGYYETEFAKIVDKSKIKLSERDKDGSILIKDTDEDAITLEEMLQNLEDDMIIIDEKYGVSVDNLAGLTDEQYYNYIHERSDKFNEYIYRYGKDNGSLQMQQNNFGQTIENWYLYAMGDGKTDLKFVKGFVDKARELFEKGNLSEFEEILMENWQNEDGVDKIFHGSTGYSIIFYGGAINLTVVEQNEDDENIMVNKNLFDCFNEQRFNLEDLPKNALQILDYQRLALTRNKTLFDLMYEDVYEKEYNEIIKIYEDEIIKNVNIIKNENVYRDLLN